MDTTIWVAIELRNENLETKAHAVLTRAGFAALMTTIQPYKRITTRGRKRQGIPRQPREALIPDGDPQWMLPGYMIVAHTGEPAFWRDIMTVKWPKGGPIAAQPVRVAGSDRVPDKAIADLEARCGEALVPAELPTLTEGQRVRILADVFAGHVGEIGSIDGDRATVIVSLFGRPTPAQVDVEKLEAA